MIIIPTEIIERLKMFCETNELGFSQISTLKYNLLLIGSNDMTPDEIHILAAHALLQGVISGMWHEANEDAKTEQQKQSDEVN